MSYKKLITSLFSCFVLFNTQASAGVFRPIVASETINATAQEVWDLITDHKNYASWNRWVVKIEGEAKVGSTVQVFNDKGKHLDLKITSMEAPYSICWLDVSWFTKYGTIAGFIGYEHGIDGWRCRTIHENKDGKGVTFVNLFQYTGITPGFVSWYARDYIRDGMILENQSIKDHFDAKGAN